MNCNLHGIELPATFKGKKWGGFTWSVTSVDAGDTEFEGVLSLARFQLQNSSGEAVLTLSSATVGQVTLNETAANAWSVTVEPRILSLDAGVYSWGLETTAFGDLPQVQISGSIEIKSDPVI